MTRPWRLGLAYGIIGQTLFVLAAFGGLTRGAVIAAVLIWSAAACCRFPKWQQAAALHIAALPSFVLALYPPVGWDATSYHLPYARLFAASGSLVFADTLRFPVFPQLGEMLFAGALLIANDAVAQLTQWLTLVVTAAAVSAIAAELGGTRARTFAAALWLGTPLAIYLGANAYIDCALAMSVTLAFGSWLIWKRTAEPKWIALAGAFAGMAAATKYHGLLFVAVLFVAAARVSWRHGLRFALPAALFAAPWYARIAYETGNPVFPFLGRVFGRSEWRPYVERHPGDYFGIPADPAIALIRRALLDPIAHGMPPYSPWLVLLLPLTIAAAVLERRLRFPLAVSAVWIALMLPFDWRFMLPVVPLLCVAIALMLERLLPRRAFALATIAFVLPGFAWGTILIAKFGPIPRTRAQRDAFVARHIPIDRALQFTGGSTVYALEKENGAYYCPARCLGELLGPYRYELVTPLLHDPPRLAAKLRAFGARYLIVEKSRHVRLPFRRVYADDAAEVFDVPSAP